ncbi:MAG TPA: hypothetical protein VFB06_09650 [Streptosporangiaceae bacterium]|nr:hypothetical protein [Streptosporangiaceae bacterium]
MPIRREVNTLSGVTSYASFFTAAASVAGALTGLLFVALSIRPQRLRGGGESSLEHQAIAATAFTALIDALFVSLAGLTPGGGTMLTSLIMGLIGLTSSAGLAARLWRARGAEVLSQRWPYLLALILAMYLAQIILALADRSAAGSDSASVGFILGMFAVGIGRSWELLGLQGGGPLDLLTRRLGHPDPPEGAARGDLGRAEPGLLPRNPAERPQHAQTEDPDP